MAYSIEDIRALDKTLQAEGETLPPPAGGMMLMGLVPADAPPLPRPIAPEPHEEEVPDVEGLHAAYEAAHQLDSIGFSIFRFYKSPLLNEKGVA
jgi:hypothetical protein